MTQEEEQEYVSGFSIQKGLDKMMSSKLELGSKLKKCLNYDTEEY